MIKFFRRIKHPIFANSIYLYFSNFFDSILLLFLVPFLARIFGPTFIGEIGLAQSIGIVFLVIQEFGFSISATKSFAEKNSFKKDKYLVEQIFTFKACLIPVILLIAFLIAITHPVFIAKPFLLLIVTFDSIFQSFIPIWYFKGKQKFKTIVITKTAFRLLAFLIIFLLVKSSNDAWIYLTLIALSSLFISIFQIFLMIKEIGRINFLGLKKVSPIIKSSYYNFIIVFLPTFFNNVGILVLSYLASPLYIGLYYGVAKIHRAFNTLFTPMFESFFPFLVSEYSISKSRALKKIKIYNFFLFLIGLGFFVIIWFFSTQIIELILGESFIDASSYLKAFGFLLPLNIFSYIWGNQWMIALGKEKKLSQLSIISNIIGILMLLILMPRLLIYAIPVSIVIMEIFKLFLIQKELKR